MRNARPTGIELVDNEEAEEHEELQDTKRACGHNGNINCVKSDKTKRTQRGNSELDQDRQNCKDEYWNKHHKAQAHISLETITWETGTRSTP